MLFRAVSTVALATAIANGAVGQGLPRKVPIVVEDHPTAISADRYFKRLEGAEIGQFAAMPEGTLTAGVKPIENRLPLTPQAMVTGKPTAKAVEGMIPPLFVIGMDGNSLAWFDSAMAGLSRHGARGLVVQASSLQAWHSLREQAEKSGIDLQLINDEPLANGYGIATYPVVMADPAIIEKAGGL